MGPFHYRSAVWLVHWQGEPGVGSFGIFSHLVAHCLFSTLTFLLFTNAFPEIFNNMSWFLAVYATYLLFFSVLFLRLFSVCPCCS